jgi:hypothetical protein
MSDAVVLHSLLQNVLQSSLGLDLWLCHKRVPSSTDNLSRVSDAGHRFERAHLSQNRSECL